MHRNKMNLVKSTKKVFNECAQDYLKEDKHWGCDLDIISEYVEKFDYPKIIELGTGHAWHLANLFYLSSRNIKKAIGVDYADNMLFRADSLLHSMLYNGKKLSEKIELKKCNILSLPFKDKYFDVAIMLNNTLGNIAAINFQKAKEFRKKALKEIRRTLSDYGYFIISVYNASKLSEEDKYGEVFEVDHKLSKLETFDLVVRFKKTNTPYYSHWFSRNEIMQLLYDVSFRIIEVEERRKRIVIVAKKRKLTICNS